MKPIKDGQYIIHRHLNGKDSILGRFSIKDDSVIFNSELDRLNSDQFPSGPMSQHTSERIEYLITNKDKDIYIEKV